MDWLFGMSSSFFDELGRRELVALKDAGFSYVEICAFERPGCGPLEGANAFCSDMARKVTDAGLAVWSVHLPFGGAADISHLTGAERDRAVDVAVRTLDATAVLKPRKAVIHPSSEPIGTADRPRRLEACRESLTRIARAADGVGIHLAVECLPRTCLGRTAAEMRAIIANIAPLEVCCDTNHLLLESTESFIRELGPGIATLHVSDYDHVDERHWVPGHGTNDWPEIVRALEEVGYAGPIMFEVRQPSPNEPLPPADLLARWRALMPQ